MMFKIAFAEDNKVNRNTFLQKIEMLPQMQLIFIAESGHDCLEQLKGLPYDKTPQVIFMDLEMPDMDGIETIRQAKALYPQVYFIVFTVFDDNDKIFEAIRAGASGYLLKHEPAAVLADAVNNVVEIGGAPMSPAIARKTLNLLSTSAPATGSRQDGSTAVNAMPEQITDREKEILKRIVYGWDAKRIASELGLSVLTVRKHIANIYNKLHINSKAQVISLAHRQGWFE